MLIILEGVDKQGKTSLANHLSQKFNIPIIKFSQPKKEAYIEYMEYLLNNNGVAILDRYYLGELVYGPIKRGGTDFKNWKVRNVEMSLLARNSLNIYCWTNEEQTRKKFIEDKEEYSKIDEILKLHSGFEKAIQSSILKWQLFDYTRDFSYWEIDRLVSMWAENLDLSKLGMFADMRVVGGHNADVLILGEVSNIILEKLEYKHINVPFANGPSADILYRALDKAGLKPTQYMISNTRKSHFEFSPLLIPELEIPQLKKIICLGNSAYVNAEDVMDGFNVKTPLGKIAHPSYVARGGIKFNEYVSIIKKCLC